MFLKPFLVLLYFECFLILNIFADTSHDLIVHSGVDHPTYIILDFLSGMSLNFTKPINHNTRMKLLKSTQNECEHNHFEFSDSTGEINGEGYFVNSNELESKTKCFGMFLIFVAFFYRILFLGYTEFYNVNLTHTEFKPFNLDSYCSSVSDERIYNFTFHGKCGLIMSLNPVITVVIKGPKTTVLPLPSKLVLEDKNYFILSNIKEWENSLTFEETNQWKYTVLKNVTTSMFVLDEKSPRNAVIFNVGAANCHLSFKLDFHVSSKCEVKFLYRNQKLKLIAENDTEILTGQKFKLYFHEGRLVGIQTHPFKVVELNVCQIKAMSAHAWKIYDVKETCQNTSFVFHSSVQIAVENTTKPLQTFYNTHYKRTTTAKTAESSTDNTWLWIVLGIIIAVILLGIGFIILYNYCSTKKKSKTSTDGLAKQYEQHKRKIKAKKRQQIELTMAEPTPSLQNVVT